MRDVTEQIIDLQTRIAYQEDALEQLNHVIAKQDSDIIQLKHHLRLLAKRLDDISLSQSEEIGMTATDERPPHY